MVNRDKELQRATHKHQELTTNTVEGLTMMDKLEGGQTTVNSGGEVNGDSFPQRGRAVTRHEVRFKGCKICEKGPRPRPCSPRYGNGGGGEAWPERGKMTLIRSCIGRNTKSNEGFFSRGIMTQGDAERKQWGLPKRWEHGVCERRIRQRRRRWDCPGFPQHQLQEQA